MPLFFVLSISFTLFTVLALPVCANSDSTTGASRAVYMEGDNLDWSDKEFDDTHWLNVATEGLPKEQTRYWVRTDFDLSNSDTVLPHDHAVMLNILGSYEIYWDGILLGKNGTPGNSSEQEIPGALTSVFRIPASLYRPGEHTISLRISSYHSQDKLRSRNFYIVLGPYERFLMRGLQQNLLPLAMLGGITIIGLYYLMIFLLFQRKAPVLLFSALCLSTAVLILTESYRGLFNYPYHWHWYRMMAVLLLSGIVGLFLVAFCLTRFETKRKITWLATCSVLAVSAGYFSPNYDSGTYFIFAICAITSLLIVFNAVRKKTSGAGLTLIGLGMVVFAMLVFPGRFMDTYLFLSFGMLVLFTLVSLTLGLSKQQKVHEAALLSSSRLEIELLKKQLQPHFILNTLTAIEEWIDESPSEAIKFIDALAIEFKVMNSMAHEKLVPLSLEIELCESHLNIMGFRTALDFLLETRIKEDALIPPAIFHTLIENAISHNHYKDQSIRMSLEQEAHTDFYCYRFSVPRVSTRNKKSQSQGTGLRYIKARLEESYPGQWTLTEDADFERWTTLITIPNLSGCSMNGTET